MKDRQRRFADEYLIDLNAEAAAVRAGILRGMQEEMHINWLQEVASRNI